MNASKLLRLVALALLAYREARGETLLGKLLVCQVAENRVQSPRWPDSYVSVITQPWQFSAFNRDDSNVTVWPREEDPVWADCVAAAQCVLDAPSPLTDANHYHAVGVEPTWASAGVVVEKVGHHVFVLI